MARLVDIDVPAEILERARAGDELAQAEIYTAVAPATFTLIRRIVADRAIAEDLFQDTLMSLYQCLKSFRGEAPLGAWLKQIAFLQSKGVTFHRRINHGMTHSVYISDPNGYGIEVLYELPREVWEGDIDAALNYAEPLPTQGEAALVDAADQVPVFGKAS